MNSERAPLKLQRGIKSKERKWGGEGVEGESRVHLYRETVKIEKMRDNSSFGQKFGQTQNNSSIGKPKKIEFVGILKLIWAKFRGWSKLEKAYGMGIKLVNFNNPPEWLESYLSKLSI